MKEVDDIILGSGPGGNLVATNSARLGRKVVIIDNKAPGGVCALQGCNPKKVIANGARLQALMDAGYLNLIPNSQTRIDWPTLHRFQKTFTQPVPDLRRQTYQELNIEFIQGTASFIDPATISINGEYYRAERFLIATGARPVKPEIKGAELVITSDEFLELSSLPSRIIVLGGGYIGLEFGFAAAQAGCEVHLIERSELLDDFDQDLVQKWSAYTQSDRFQFHLHQQVHSIEQTRDGLRVSCESGLELEGEMVLAATGRRASIDDLNLSAAGVVFNDQGVCIDQHCSTNIDHVWAVGDCAASGYPRLTTVSELQAEVVAANWNDGRSRSVNYDGIATTVFCFPALAKAGRTESELVSLGIEFRKLSGDWTTKGNTRKLGRPIAAGYKILLDKDGKKILGAHLLGPEASEQINLLALAMRCGIDAEQLANSPFAYPTFSSDVAAIFGDS